MLQMVVRCSCWCFVGQKCGVRSQFGGGSHKSAIRSPVINEAVRQPRQAFNFKLQSEKSHGLLQQPEAPVDFKPTQAQIQARLVHH
jgi:hypothetical protein